MSELSLVDTKWTKGGTDVAIHAWVCSCGGVARQITYVGCANPDNDQYLAQCVACKDVHSVEHWPREDAASMSAAGWVQFSDVTETK